MKRLFYLLLLCCSSALAFTQVSSPIKRAYAFYTLSMPGNVFTDDKGNTVPPVASLSRTIYFECSGTQMPVITGIQYCNTLQKTELTRMPGTTVIVGKHIETGKDYAINGRKGFTMWKIDIYPADDAKTVKGDCKLIIIKSKSGGRLSRCYLYSETELMPMPRY